MTLSQVHQDTYYSNLSAAAFAYNLLSLLLARKRENTPFLLHTSSKMKPASASWNPRILGSNSQRRPILSRCRSSKMISKWTNVSQNSRSFYWNTWDGKQIHQFIWGFCFPTDVMVHCPHYIEPAFIVSRRLVLGLQLHWCNLEWDLRPTNHSCLDTVPHYKVWKRGNIRICYVRLENNMLLGSLTH